MMWILWILEDHPRTCGSWVKNHDFNVFPKQGCGTRSKQPKVVFSKWGCLPPDSDDPPSSSYRLESLVGEEIRTYDEHLSLY